MTIKAKACALAAKHGSRDPLKIACDMGCMVMFVPMQGLRGFYRHMNRCSMIFIDSSLDETQARLVCAHELGHIMLHKGINRMFMDRCTLNVSGKYELEAHRFSVDLVYSDDELEPYLSRPISDAASYMGVSESLAQYRLSSIKPKWKIEN